MFLGICSLCDESIRTVGQLPETYALKKDGYCSGKILTDSGMWLMGNGLFLFTFKTDADWQAVNDVTITEMVDGKMHQFDLLSGHIRV